MDVDDSYPDEEVEGRRVLNQQAMEMATSLALSEFADLHVVHAWEAIGEGATRSGFTSTDEGRIQAHLKAVQRRGRENLEALMRKKTNRLGPETSRFPKPKVHLVKSWARTEIPFLVRELGADLVVVGTGARTGIGGLLVGNTVEMLLTQIDCLALTLKPEGFLSPVTPESQGRGRRPREIPGQRRRFCGRDSRIGPFIPRGCPEGDRRRPRTFGASNPGNVPARIGSDARVQGAAQDRGEGAPVVDDRPVKGPRLVPCDGYGPGRHGARRSERRGGRTRGVPTLRLPLFAEWACVDQPFGQGICERDPRDSPPVGQAQRSPKSI